MFHFPSFRLCACLFAAGAALLSSKAIPACIDKKSFSKNNGIIRSIRKSHLFTDNFHQSNRSFYERRRNRNQYPGILHPRRPRHSYSRFSEGVPAALQMVRQPGKSGPESTDRFYPKALHRLRTLRENLPFRRHSSRRRFPHQPGSLHTLRRMRRHLLLQSSCPVR